MSEAQERISIEHVYAIVSRHVRTMLQNDNIEYIDEIEGKSDEELLRTPGFGHHRLRELRDAIKTIRADGIDLDDAIRMEEITISEAEMRKAKLLWRRNKAPVLEKNILEQIQASGAEIGDPVKKRVRELIQFIGVNFKPAP